MVVYLDVLILENWIVNAFLLYITSQTLRIRLKPINILISSLFGGLYVITVVSPSLRILTTLPFKLLIALLMIVIAFRKKEVLFNIKAAIIYILFSMMLAGLCFFIQFNKGTTFQYINSIYNFSYKDIMLSIMIIYMIIHRLIIYLKDRKELYNFIYDVDICVNNLHTSVKAFLDTGNELREPATNLPVMIVEKELFNGSNLDSYDKYYVPYKVLSGHGGRLIGIKPDYIKIDMKNKIETKEVILAFCEDKLSSLNDYKALLSRGIL